MNATDANPGGPFIGSPDNPRTGAVVCYITFIGWLIAYFALYRGRKTEFTAFHIRQSLLIHIISFILKAAYGFLRNNNPAFITICIISAGLFLVWCIGFFDSLNDQQKPVPLIGNIAQGMFRTL